MSHSPDLLQGQITSCLDLVVWRASIGDPVLIFLAMDMKLTNPPCMDHSCLVLGSIKDNVPKVSGKSRFFF